MRSLCRFVLLAALLVPPAAPAAHSATAPALRAEGPEGEFLGDCPLRHTAVTAEVAGFVAAVTVRQRFENPFDRPIEAVYTFPLSARGAVSAMRIRTGERTIRGEIRRREEARRIYENARAAGQVAALLDEERPNVFAQRIANLVPGAAIEVEIEYRETLAYEAGAFEWSFPTVVGPRFVPGGGRVPDAARIAPPVTPEGTRAGHDFSMAVAIEAGVPIRGVASKLHEIEVARPTPTSARVSLRRGAEIPDRDFVLRIDVAGEEIASGVLTHRGEGDGYATFVLLPPARLTPDRVAPKELVFVVDRSGSQSGLPLEKAKETLLWILERMGPDDTFQVVSFSNRTELLFPRPERATPDAKRRARAYVSALQANGGTHMAEAIAEIAATPADAHRLRIVTFMTDGYVGNDHEVIELVRRTRGTSRWFAFGTGNSVNRYLLDGIARHGGGEVEYVLLSDPGEAVARRFWERIASPVLTDVRLELQGLAVTEVFPRTPSDVWAERPLVFHARYGRAGRGRVVVHGFRAGEPWRGELDVELPARKSGNDAIAAMWARAKVEDLLARDLAGLQLESLPDALRDEVVEIALAHAILTPFTSFVAVEERVVNEGGVQRTVSVPVEMPQGVQYEGIFGESEDEVAKMSGAGGFAAAPTARALLRRAAPAAEGRSNRIAATSFRRGSSEPEPVAPLSATARRRLSPDLLALLDGRAPEAVRARVVGGEIEVRVVLRDRSARALVDLARVGLTARVVTDAFWIGQIEVAALARLAELDCVESVALP
jgi:Ca-activated chloride channel family protein